jgi:hypothetical protein
VEKAASPAEKNPFWPEAIVAATLETTCMHRRVKSASQRPMNLLSAVIDSVSKNNHQAMGVVLLIQR